MLQFRSPEVQITVTETEVFPRINPILDQERRSLRLAQYAQGRGPDLQRSRFQVLVYRAAAALYDTHYRDRGFGLQRPPSFIRVFQLRDDLHDAGSVPQVHKDDPALVPAFCYPAHQRDGAADHFLRYFGASAGALQSLH